MKIDVSRQRSLEASEYRVQLPQLKVALNNNNNYSKYVCKVHHQSKSSSVPQRAAQITFAASAAARDRTHTHSHANGNHINHTHRAALGGDFCIARNARTAAGIGVKR